MQFVIFLSLVLLVLISAHALLFFLLTRFFSAWIEKYRFRVVGVIAWLSISFFVASLLVHWHENFLTQTLYFSAGWWLGFMTNFILLALGAWGLSVMVQRFGWQVSRPFFGGVVFMVALCVSVWGSWNAFHPRVREVTVQIPALPSEWQGKKIVHMTDLHLGAIYGSRWLERVVMLANLVQPEIVLITGDLYDGMDAKLNSLALPLNQLSAPRGTYFVTGNHETYLGVPEVLAALKQTSVQVLDNETIDIDGLTLVGLSYPERRLDTRVVLTTLKGLESKYMGKPTILLFHAPVHIEEFKASGVHLQLAGHTHKGQIFPFGLVTRLIYKGYDYGLYPMGDYTLSTSNGVGTWGPAMRIGNIPEIVSITLTRK